MAVRALAPPQAAALRWQWPCSWPFATWRYPVTAAGRDLRLDFLRGFCVFAMVVDHIGGASWLYALTGGNSALVSAAEGFVFLSGLVMGLVYREKIARVGLRAATWAALARARTLYLLTVSLTLVFAAITVWTDLALWVDRAGGLGIESWPELVVATLTLRYTWHGTDILALYTVLVAATPLALFLMAERRTAWLLAGSWGLWSLHHLYPAYAVVPWPIQHAANFPIAAWQALFVTALAVGYHRGEIYAWIQDALDGRGALPRMGLAGGASLLLALAWVWGAQPAAAIAPGEGLFSDGLDLFDKVSLGPGRMALFLLAAGGAIAITTYLWRPLATTLGWALIPLGQASLYVYAMHLFVILLAYNVPPFVGSTEAGSELHNTVGQLALVLLLWAMVRTRFLYGVVPR